MNGQDEYLESKVMTASPYHLHLMVLEGAMRHATRAEQALAESDWEAAHFSLNDSRGFITELISGLNDEQSPELVDKLKGLFLFVFRKLVQADLERDANKLRDALKILQMHRETWLELAEKLEVAGAGQSPSSSPLTPHIATPDSPGGSNHAWST